ncbi:hypothetical protein ACQJ0H_22565, partial [Pantoea agglomerans]|uniref:hypothetical protein n=1 Tax=Enterobacter agglomerans TaxID=549 RepID=UPI003CF2E129
MLLVGVSLLAIAECQATLISLTQLNREQAKAYRGFVWSSGKGQAHRAAALCGKAEEDFGL